MPTERRQTLLGMLVIQEVRNLELPGIQASPGTPAGLPE